MFTPKGYFLRQFDALFLTLCLILPVPVWALRTEPPSETGAVQEIKAGLEENSLQGAYEFPFSEQLIDLMGWLEEHGTVQWEAGPRYGTAMGEIKAVRSNRIQVWPSEEWGRSFPELKKLFWQHKEADQFKPRPGTFGQIVLRGFQSGEKIFTLIEEIQPSDGYRRLKQHQRKKLDAWRRQAVGKIIEWAKSRGFSVARTDSQYMHGLTPYEIEKNYVEPFESNQWTRQDERFKMLSWPRKWKSWYIYTPAAGLEEGSSIERRVQELFIGSGELSHSG